MTLLQAMERTDWSLRVSSVGMRDSHGYILLGQKPPPPLPCEICDNEMGSGHYVSVVGPKDEIYVVDIGPICAHDIRRGIGGTSRND